MVSILYKKEEASVKLVITKDWPVSSCDAGFLKRPIFMITLAPLGMTTGMPRLISTLLLAASMYQLMGYVTELYTTKQVVIAASGVTVDGYFT